MYNYGYEKQKYEAQKKKEEELLRLLGFPEWKIQYLREMDDYDFNRNRSFHRFESTTDSKFFLNKPSYDHISEYTLDDLLSCIDDEVLYRNLIKANPIMQMIIIMLQNDCDIKEIAEDLHMTENAIYKRIYNFRRKCKKEG